MTTDALVAAAPAAPYPDDPIKPGQAAKLLGVHPSAVYRYMEDGRLRWWELPSGHRRLSRAEVLALPRQGKPARRGKIDVRVESQVELVERRRKRDEGLKRFGLA